MQSEYTGGFVKVPRRLLDEGTFRDIKDFGLFVRFLLKAAHKPTTVNFRQKTWHLSTGQLVTTHTDLKKLGIGPNTIRTALKNFSDSGLINIKANKAGTVITVCNYAEIYGALSNTNTTTIKQATHAQHTANTQNKNLRNKEDKNTQEIPSFSQSNVRPFARSMGFTASAQNLLKNAESET